MQSDQVRGWLIDWFEKRGTNIDKTGESLKSNYFELGLVDSLGLMELMTALEGTFHIRFSEDHFQDPRFSTIQGLSELITELACQKDSKTA